MAVKTEVLETDGIRIEVTTLPTMRGLRLLARISKILGPAVVKGAGSLTGAAKGGKVNVEDMDLAVLGDAAGTLFEKLSEDDLESITRELLSSATVIGDGSRRAPLMPVFDVVFAGNMPAVFATLAFAFRVNYGNFLDVVRGMLAANEAAAPTAEKSGPRAVP